MSLIGGTGVPIARRQKRVALQGPGEPVPDGDGGWTETMVALDPPSMFGYVRPATTSELENMTAGTVVAQATHLVTLPFHSGVTTETELMVEDYPNAPRRLAVVAVLDPDERSVELLLICSEVVP